MRLDIEVLGDADTNGGSPVRRATVVPSDSGGLFVVEAIRGEDGDFSDIVSRRVGFFGLSDTDIDMMESKIIGPEVLLGLDTRTGVWCASDRVEQLVAEIEEATPVIGGTWRVITSFKEFQPVFPTL